jgi:hypothetical protein
VHFRKILVGFCAYLEGPHGILCTFGSSSWDFVHFESSSCDFVQFWKFFVGFVHFWKFLISFYAFMEVLHGILCIYGSSSWDFVHFWNFLMAKHTRVHFILSLFLYKIRVFATWILIDCGYRWLQPVQNVIL